MSFIVNMDGDKPIKTINQIQGLRASWALFVAFSHSLYVFSLDGIRTIWNTSIFELNGFQSYLSRILLIFANGSLVVTSFLVLSGFLLSKSLSTKEFSLKTIFRFSVKRFLRLYPVYFIAIICGFIIFMVTSPLKSPYVSEWVTFYMSGERGTHVLLKNLMFESLSLSAVAIPLKAEIVMCFLFPFIYFLQKKNQLIDDVIIFSFLFFWSYSRTTFFIGEFAVYFYCGIMIEKYSFHIISFLEKFRRRSFYLIIFIMIVLSGILNYRWGRGFEIAYAVIMITSAFYIKENNNLSFLKNKILVKLGNISYAFYLFHYIVLYSFSYVIIKVIGDKISPGLYLISNLCIFITSTLAAIFISTLLHRLVETPSIKTAEKWERRIYLN